MLPFHLVSYTQKVCRLTAKVLSISQNVDISQHGSQYVLTETDETGHVENCQQQVSESHVLKKKKKSPDTELNKTFGQYNLLLSTGYTGVPHLIIEL